MGEFGPTDLLLPRHPEVNETAHSPGLRACSAHFTPGSSPNPTARCGRRLTSRHRRLIIVAVTIPNHT